MAKVADIVKKIRSRGKLGQTETGCAIYRWFSDAERYIVDFASDFKKEGWMQYDTDQDAPYFGVWVNPKKRMVLDYAEGDWSLVLCPSPETFRAWIEHMNEFYGESFEFKTIDAQGRVAEYRQGRSSFLSGTKPEPPAPWQMRGPGRKMCGPGSRPMTTVEKILVKRDGMTPGEARKELQWARQRVLEGEDPEEILFEEFGLEPDYIFDLIP